MTEVWLRGNRRIIYTAAVVPLVMALVGVAFLAAADESSLGAIAGWTGLGMTLLGGVVLGILLMLARQPRLAYRDGHLLVYLRPTGPIRVPIEIVEAFLAGQGPTSLPGTSCKGAETVTIVIRLADRAVEWSHLAVHPVLGSWCDGYITLRGTWCEPLTVDAVMRLNERLSEVQRTAVTHDATR